MSQGLPEEEMYTIKEVAAALRMSPMAIYRAANSGKLNALRVGRSFRIPQSAYDAYKKAVQTGAT